MNKIIKNLIIIFIILVLAFIITTVKNGGFKIHNQKIIAEEIHSKLNDGLEFKMKVIFDNGAIYSWEYGKIDKDLSEYNLDNEEELKKIILNEGKKINNKVNKSDIKEIIKKLDEVKENKERKCLNIGKGNHVTTVWKNEKRLVLKESGDCEVKSNNSAAKKIVSILKKYF